MQIGDYAALNFGAVIQNHLFEDRVMKSSYLHIGDSCAVGNMAVVLYDSEMAGGAVLGPLSLLMKGESLAAGSTWHGIPAPRTAPGPGTSAFSPPLRHCPQIWLRRRKTTGTALVSGAADLRITRSGHELIRSQPLQDPQRGPCQR